MKSIILFKLVLCSFILTAQPTTDKKVAKNNHVNFYGGFGRNVESSPHYYVYSGVRIGLEDRNILYFNVDGYYSQKSSSYSLFNPNDYTFEEKRMAIQMGGDAVFIRKKKYRFSAGFNLTYSEYFDHIRSSDTTVLLSLQNNHAFKSLSISISMLGEYNLTRKSALFAKANFNISKRDILHNPVIVVGYNFKLYTAR